MDIAFLRQLEPGVAPDERVLSGFGTATLKAGEVEAFDHTVSTIVFLLEGEVEVESPTMPTFMLKAGNMLVSPTRFFHSFVVTKDVFAVFIYLPNDNKEFCDAVLTQNTLENMPVLQEDVSHLPMQSVIRDFAKTISQYIRDKKFTHDISNLKEKELIALLRDYHSAEEMAYFLAPLYSASPSFYGRVMEMAKQYCTVGEIAQALNMSRSTFERHFRDIFHEAPKTWLAHMRATMLERSLKYTDMRLEAISKQLRFSSPQHMSKFCREHLGVSPSALRRKL